jgi:hypothetical protein
MGISMPDIFFPQMSVDGRKIAFTSREDAPEEIWALENPAETEAGQVGSRPREASRLRR